ncbi:gephyrin-like molybdotransferase receptor GlpR [Streptomyces vietnamensis]|uniref:Membrane protein n=1 Tax=Streptomyces vietnamensis TaxID=362257 RepID=A0A0B5I5K9_9ACTN|nr:gephyrin-like molybdotransferase receptor GlpR [Streptomyces vietnamensis]AJF65657.1 membrane protein [Streptomyces vietnamensis]
MSSSGLIYAVIVGAWAAYLVPMWLRRQDELNEARPTERFSTAIRLLSGRAGMERRYAKELKERDRTAQGPTPDVDPDAETEHLSSVDVRAFSAPAARTEARLELPEPDPEPAPSPAPARPAPGAAERARRGKVLARRRRVTTLLFAAFTLGAVVAAVGGVAFLWAPAVPALLLSAYIVHLRIQERRRFVYVMDRRRAEAAAARLRESRRPAPTPEPEADPTPAPAVSPQEADRRALVEQTDHAEWVDQQRERGPARGDSWDPVPVPLPTYVTAPVAPRATNGIDITDPETWSAARSSTAADPAPTPSPAPRQRTTPPRRGRDHGRTPLFDQYADDDRPRAANE